MMSFKQQFSTNITTHAIRTAGDLQALGGFFMTVAKETELCQDELVKRNATSIEKTTKEEIIV